MTAPPTDDLPEGVVNREVSSEGVVEYLDTENLWHNPDGPATIHPDKATYWLVTGQDPDEMPDWWFGARHWYFHGKLHRTDGPASEFGNGTCAYWVYDRQFTEDEFLQHYPSTHQNPATDSQS